MSSRKSVSIFRLRLTETSWDQLEVEVATLPFPAFSGFLPWAVGTLSAGCVRLCPGTVVSGSAHPSPFSALEGLQCGSLPCFALSLPYGKSQWVWGRSWPKLANCSWIWGYCHLWLCLARAWHLAERPPRQASRGPAAFNSLHLSSWVAQSPVNRASLFLSSIFFSSFVDTRIDL